MPRLSEANFKATMSQAPQRVQPDERAPFDFWTYFDQIPPDDFEGHDFSAGAVSNAWVMQDGRWEHVLVDSEDKNIFMVVVLDLCRQEVLGHYLLDLPKIYGLEDS